MRTNINPLVGAIGKPAAEFTRADLVRYAEEQGVTMVNFMYPAADGRLKTLNFVVADADYLDTILTWGERVDGSSLFPFIEAGSSDLYVVPRLRTAFIDPFAELPTLCFLCSYFDKDGNRLPGGPDHTLDKAVEAFRSVTGMEFEAMGELEYYVIAAADDAFPATDQRCYHESAPFAKFNDFRTMCMDHIARAGGRVKYGHSEVGNFTLDGRVYEQNEIEFMPAPAAEAADQLVVAKWIIRNLAHQYGFDVTFAPKITVGKAGSGMHIHMRITKDGANQVLDGSALSPVARRAIAGLMTLAPSITAFGNTNPSSYLRLVPNQEAPTSVCWGDRNRSVLVRVPLGWTSGRDMASQVNPLEKPVAGIPAGKQTFEMRSPDASANVYMLLAALAVACRHGFEMKDALQVAEKTYVDVNIHKAENKAKMSALDHLPDSCAASAVRLGEQRAVYERYGVFTPAAIDAMIRTLESYSDGGLRAALEKHPEKMRELVERYFYCG